MKRFTIYIAFLALPFFLLSCGEEMSMDEPTVKMARMPVPKRATPPVKKTAPKPIINKTSPDDVMRNPFKSFIVPDMEEDGRVRGPLECCELGLFRLLAVISGVDNPRALVLAPDGKKYIVKKGDIMGLRSSVITKIVRDKVVLEEKMKDPFGKLVTKDIFEMMIPSGKDRNKK